MAVAPASQLDQVRRAGAIGLYAGAFFPGLLLASLYIFYVVLIAKLKPRLAPPLPAAKRGGRRRTTLLREVLNALLYLLRTGCPLRGSRR